MPYPTPRSESVVLTRDQDVLLRWLVENLPRPPAEGLSKEELLTLYDPQRKLSYAAREAWWSRVYQVILLNRKAWKQRQPETYIIEQVGDSDRDSRWQVLGINDDAGRSMLYVGSFQLRGALRYKTRIFRTKATTLAELMAINYVDGLTDALDRKDTASFRALCREMVRESLVVAPAFSLIAQMVGVEFPQGRSFTEIAQGFKTALNANPSYGPFLGRSVDDLCRMLEKGQKDLEKPLAEFLGQLIPLALTVHGLEKIQAQLTARANALDQKVAAEMLGLPAGGEGSEEE